MTAPSSAPPLRTVPAEAWRGVSHQPLDAATLAASTAIVDDVAARGEAALREYCTRFGDCRADAPLVLGREAMQAALREIPAADRRTLESVATRIRAFARAQRAALLDTDVAIPGGRAGHRFIPLGRAGCYTPGGRYPLPSSLLMTAVTARVAGVNTVVVAAPRPGPVTLAAAAIAGADLVLCAGGAHAVAALSHGVADLPPVDIIVGPGNRWVTAAKQLVAGRTAIDMLAGPSELTVLADQTADPAVIAADLLAQAEHDTDAVPVLVTTSSELIEAVNAELTAQVATLPTGQVARAALANGAAVLARSLDEAIDLTNSIAPEHLELMVVDPAAVTRRLIAYGALFIGADAAEVLGDYGAGPNHVLPTGGTARWSAGLSVLSFLRARTWMRIDDRAAAAPLAADAAALARLEGLEAHARAAERRRSPAAVPPSRPAPHSTRT